MEERFIVREIHICPFDRESIGKLKPKLEEYPPRYCVIDKEKQIAIDIELKLKYDYIETISWVHFVNQSYKKIQDDRRVAIYPYKLMNEDSFDLVEAVKIINQLKNNYEYPDGNEVYNNEQYLEHINKETKEKSNVKKKNFIKRKK